MKPNINFEGKIFCITGGTGSFGKAMLRYLLDTKIKEIRIFSRDEKKQDDLRRKINDGRVKFFLGDVRNLDDLNQCFVSVDFVFHAAALKQVPSCEFFPLQAVETNIEGTKNAVNAARKCNVKKFVFLSTDKAVYPINAMGISKAMAEKVVQAAARDISTGTSFMITRYGNVMGSRGSVIPLFLEQAISNKRLTVTDPGMTRFMMNLGESIGLVLYALSIGKSGYIYINKAPAATIEDLANSILRITKSTSKIEDIGVRHGEKLYETLVSKEEMSKALDQGDYYQIPLDSRDLNYSSYVEKGYTSGSSKTFDEFNSHNANRIIGKDLDSFLLRQGFILEALK